MKTIVIKYDIDIVLEQSSEIAAAIAPIFDGRDRIVPSAWSDYEEFITNLIGVFSQNGYEFIKETRENYKPSARVSKVTRNADLSAYPSPYSESYYFRMYKKSESSPENIKCLIIVRVSAHKLEDESELDLIKRVQLRKNRNTWLEHEAYRLRQPQDKSRQKWRFKQITLDSKPYDSYDDVLDEIEHNIQSWR